MKTIACLLISLLGFSSAFAKCNGEVDKMFDDVYSIYIFDQNLDILMTPGLDGLKGSVLKLNEMASNGTIATLDWVNHVESRVDDLNFINEDTTKNINSVESKIFENATVGINCLKTHVSVECGDKAKNLEKETLNFLEFTRDFTRILSKLSAAYSSYGIKLKEAAVSGKATPNANEILAVYNEYSKLQASRKGDREYILQVKFSQPTIDMSYCTK